MTYQLKGAHFEIGDHVSYAEALYVVKARRLSTIGIVYQLISQGAEPESVHNVPQAALDPAPMAAAPGGRR